ncbi:MAG: peptide deformylase [Pseudomonadota bacterium]
MAKLDILIYPDPRLRHVAAPETEFDDELKTLVDDMAETMYAAPGIGLAAIQVNVQKRVVVMDLSEDKNDLMVFINPEITEIGGKQEYEEGCLSIPGYFATVERVERVRIDACDVNGDPFTVEADGLLSVCIQHEVDHLNGKLFVDYLSRLKRERLRRKMKKESRQSETQAA